MIDDFRPSEEWLRVWARTGGTGYARLRAVVSGPQDRVGRLVHQFLAPLVPAGLDDAGRPVLLHGGGTVVAEGQVEADYLPGQAAEFGDSDRLASVALLLEAVGEEAPDCVMDAAEDLVVTAEDFVDADRDRAPDGIAPGLPVSVRWIEL